MKKINQIFILLLCAVFALTACNVFDGGNQAAVEKQVIKIGYLPITHALPLYLQKDLEAQGFKNFELELVRFGSWPDLIDALNAGQIDGASMLITLAMKAKEQGIPIKTVALGHRDGNVVVGAKDIATVADLKGKTFAIPHKFSPHNILLYQMLKKNNLNYTDVNVVELPPAEMPSALAQGSISGYAVAEPFGAASVVLGNGNVLYQSTDLWPDSICCALVLRSEFLEGRKEAAQEFVSKYIEAGKLAEQKDEHTRKVSLQYLKVDEKVLEQSLEWISYDDLKLDESSYAELSRLLVEMGLLENPPKYEDFVDNSFFATAE
jgi:NitT/TauT family transport system substrate-binding protein